MYMKILLLYNGYPRLSQSYQYDEAIELLKRHQVMIVSWSWPLYQTEEGVPPYISGDPDVDPEVVSQIRTFQPDHIHAHYLTNAAVAYRLARRFNATFSLRAHSFDTLAALSSATSSATQGQLKYINNACCKTVYVFHPFREKLIAAGYPVHKLRGYWPSINITPFRNIFTIPVTIPVTKDIMSGGAFLPKKDIKSFIRLAREIKNRWHDRIIRYYSVEEDPAYVSQIYRYNTMMGSPVVFLTVQHCDMPAEYVKHQWLIYSCCPLLGTVGLPLMVAEAQASGVGVIMYRLRDDLDDYVTNNGYLYRETSEVLAIIAQDFDPVKRQAAHDLSTRYDIAGFNLELG